MDPQIRLDRTETDQPKIDPWYIMEVLLHIFNGFSPLAEVYNMWQLSIIRGKLTSMLHN
jgi:hypothetical protein